MSEGNPDDKQDQVEWVPPLADEMADLGVGLMQIIFVVVFTLVAISCDRYPQNVVPIMLGLIAFMLIRINSNLKKSTLGPGSRQEKTKKS